VVTNTDGQSGIRASAFTYLAPAPTVTSVMPASGSPSGGTPITIAGANFAAGASVSVGGAPATAITVVDSTTITATTPAHAIGAVNIVVTNPDGQRATLISGFTFAISFIQVAEATPQAPAAVVQAVYPAAQTAGDLNIVIVGWYDTSANVSSVVDTTGNVYKLAITTSGNALRQSIYYASNIRGGANVVTVQFNRAATNPGVRVLQYRGVGALDVTAGKSGSSTTANSGSAKTTAAGELILGANASYKDTAAAGAGFTMRIISSIGDLAEDRVVTAVGTYSATSTLQASGRWVMQMVTFK